jgi:hypothetical protein
MQQRVGMPLETHERQHLACDTVALRFRHVLKTQAERDVVKHVEPWHQRILLKYDATIGAGAVHQFAVQTNFATGWLDKAGDAIEQGRLAATRRAERHDELARLDTQIDIGKRNVRRRASRTFEGNVQLPDLQTTHRDTCWFGTLCGAGVLT